MIFVKLEPVILPLFTSEVMNRSLASQSEAVLENGQSAGQIHFFNSIQKSLLPYTLHHKGRARNISTMTWIQQNITTYNYDLNLSSQMFNVINNIPKG